MVRAPPHIEAESKMVSSYSTRYLIKEGAD